MTKKLSYKELELYYQSSVSTLDWLSKLLIRAQRLEKRLIIHANVTDFIRALSCLEEYLALPNSQRQGESSVALFQYKDGMGFCFYVTRSGQSIVIRRNYDSRKENETNENQNKEG